MLKLLSSKYFKHTVLAAFIIRIMSAFTFLHPDVRNHTDWGIRFFQYGPAEFFGTDANVWNFTWPNQPPGSILIFAGIRKLFEALFAFLWWLNVNIAIFPSAIITYSEIHLYSVMIQFPSILADFGIAYLIYKTLLKLKSVNAARLGATIFLINPVIWYNSAVWGQTDAIVNFFGFLAFYLLFKNKFTFAIFAFALSLYIKISLAIFIPIFLLVAWKKSCIKNILIYSIPTWVSIWVVTSFFSSNSEHDPLTWLFYLYKNKVLTQQLQVITANAFNIWATITGILEQPHTLPFLGLTYQYWSYILFSAFFAPILFAIWKKQNEKTVYTALALTAFAVWSLLTNMHERYLYPLFPYFTILAALNTRLIPTYWIVSGISLLNLYHFWWTPRIGPIVKVMLFGDRLAPRILGAINFGIFIKFYKENIKKLV